MRVFRYQGGDFEKQQLTPLAFKRGQPKQKSVKSTV
jgi:hypothetical protein